MPLSNLKIAVVMFSVMLLTIPPLLSQEDTVIKPYHLGIQVGMNASRVAGTSFSGINKVGIYTSAFIIRDVNQKLALEFNLSYSQKGTLKPPNHKQNDYTKYLMKLAYSELCVIGRYKHKSGIYYDAGLGVGYLLQALETDENNQTITSNGEFRKMEFSALVGIQFPISNRIEIGARGSHSILPIRKHINGATFRFNRGQLNQVLSFTLRYTIKK
ncbi:MAG: outer membrane beta-barrel protein [Crocinitomicaceae bacterium]|nr:outer membrane beta-barrel protein [Crocinitomicaceae bacterium]